MNTSLRLLVTSFALTASACTLEVADDTVVDTVLVRDTVVRVETLLVRDTVVALGGIPGVVSTTSPGAPAPTIPAAPAVTRPVVPPVLSGDVESMLRARRLMVPVAGVSPAQLVDSYHEKRGARVHEALDIGAPRGTPVVSADEGKVAKLFTSDGGGLTVYVADVTGQLIFYYAHLDAYQPGLREGMTVRAGDVLGTVGTTGNAPPNTPHLHFAIGRMDEKRLWYRTIPINPKPYLTVPGAARR